MDQPEARTTPDPTAELTPELLLRFVESTSDLLTVVDREGRFRYVNPASRHFLGLPPEECLGREAFDFVHPSERERSQADYAQWLSVGESRSLSYENHMLTADGRDVHVLWTCTPQLDEQGQVVSFVSIGRDVSDRTRAERSLRAAEARQREILTTMLDALIGIDLRGTVLLASASVERILGWKPKDLIGRNIREIIPEPHQSKHDGYLAEYRRTGRTWILGATREFEVVRKDGERIWCELSVSRADVPGQEPVLIGSFREVTDRRRADEALQAGEARQREILASMLDALIGIDLRGTVVLASESVERVLGWKPDEMVGRNIKEIIPEPHRSRHDEYLSEYVRTGRTWILGATREFEVVRKDGTRIWCELSVSRADVPGQEPVLIGSFRDVTARKVTDMALRASETRQREILASMLDALIGIDLAGKVQLASQSVERVLGWRPDELIGRNIKEIIPEPHRSQHDGYLASYVRTGNTWILGRTREFEVVRKDGTLVWCELSVSRADVPGQEPVLIGSLRDVSDRKRAEAALQASVARQRRILASMLDALIGIDLRGTVLLASDSVERILGWKPEQLVGRNIKVIIPEPHHSKHDAYLAEYVRTGRTWILGATREFEVLRRDGTRIWCELSVSRADSPGQDPVLIGSLRDITDRKRAEAELTESERRFHAVFDGTYQYLGLLRPDGTVVEINRTALDAVGGEREALLGTHFWEGPWFRGRSAERVRRAIEEAAEGDFVRFELDLVSRDGGKRAIDFSVQPVRDESGAVVMLIPEGRDITEIKRVQRAETAMLRALATIGENAALLAHEIKNPLTGVNLALRAVADALGEDQKAILEDLASRMRRLEALMRRTLTFARPLELHPTPFAVQELVTGVAQSFAAELRQREVTLELDLPEEEIELVADRQRMEEVLTNLVRNALEVDLPPVKRVRIAARERADEVELAVEDDGPGIPLSARETVFRPFETSKRDGTGLGLAIVRKIVEDHGGHAAAEDGALSGARFVLTLPLTPVTG